MNHIEQKVSRILLVEDHAAFRQALAFVFDQDPEFELSAEAGSVAEGIAAGDDIDVAVVDLFLPDGEGVEVVRALHERNPQCLVLILSASLDRAQYARAVEVGAAGIMHKSARLTNIVDAVRRLRNGEALLTPNEVIDYLRLALEERGKTQEAQDAAKRLTRRERDVLQALADGLDSKEIAEKLHITPETERTHMVNIFTKLKVHSRLQALVFAVRYGVVQISRK